MAVSEFDCGIDAETLWLRRHALQAEESGTNRTYVVRRLEDDRVVGYSALATGSVMNSGAPPRLMKGAASYDQPVIILTRMGVDLAEDEWARDFSMRVADFEPSPTDPLHLILLMKDRRRALAG